MKKYYVIGIIFLVCVFSISEGRSEIALTQEQEQKAAKIDSLIKFYYEQGVFSGSVLVAEAGKIIYQEGIGYANVDTKEKLQPKSVFRLASLSKQFTAMCIMILKERGKLDYDDDIQKYLPEVKYNGITIRHLLWHTSGVPHYMEFMSRHYSDEEWYVNDDVLRVLATEKLVRKDTIQEAYKPYVLNDGSVGDYGFGWSVSEVDANAIVEHSGSWIGFRTYILRDITGTAITVDGGESLGKYSSLEK
jgi:CubicO group peptidase (beta-lactamase class C family)